MEETTIYEAVEDRLNDHFPQDLPKEKVFIPGGMFLGWLMDHDLYSDDFKIKYFDQITSYKVREITGPELLKISGGRIASDMLSDEGNEFAQFYYSSPKNKFLNHFRKILAPELPSVFHVENSWENYGIIKRTIDEAHTRWKRKQSKTWWEFWI